LNALHPIRRGPRFLTLEGGEGAGKSTLAAALETRFAVLGQQVLRTREPGGSPGAEVLRHVLLSGAVKPMGPVAEALLFAAAREDHVRTLIRPALASGTVVICDRFADSTRAYQGAGGGVEPGIVDALERIAVGPTRPDLTFILDIDPREGLARVARRAGAADRFETEDLTFHDRLRAAFRAIAARDPARCVVLDASRPAEVIASSAWRAIEQWTRGAKPAVPA
jgi:dTMP kinase